MSGGGDGHGVSGGGGGSGRFAEGALYARAEELQHAVVVTRECLRGVQVMALTCGDELCREEGGRLRMVLRALKR